MKKKVVVFSRISSQAVLQDLRERFDLHEFSDPLGSQREAFLAALEDADGLFGASLPLGEALLAGAARLRVIASVSAGYDNYDLNYLRSRGIRLTNTPDAVTETTADTGFMLLMMTARRAPELLAHVREDRWTSSVGDELYGLDVHGKRLGIVGLGRIGAAVARRAHFGFGMSILYAGRRRQPEYEAEFGARHLPLDALLEEADFVCLCVPLTPETRHLIGAEQLARMKPEAILVNISRGAVLDEAALLDALRAGQLRAAGLDVFEREPLRGDSPLLALPNVVALPHIGSATREARALMARTAAADLVSVLAGGEPKYAVI